MDRKTVTLIPGDGIGPEITEAVQDIFEAARVPIDWEVAEAGIGAIKESGSGLPPETLQSIRRNRVALKGPTTTPLGGGHKSVNVSIRKALDLFANVRPAISLPAVKTRYEDVDLLVVRENIEDTYGGIEYWQTPDTAQCLRIITRTGSAAVIRYALEMARSMGRERLTCVHKANIHKMTDGLFLETFRDLSADYSGMQCDDILIDNLCMQLVSRPEQFDVLVMPNLFGDIVSDLCAGLVGGLGVAPAANIGDGRAVFEAVHGSAPDIAGLGLANPTAILLSAIQMLHYLGLHDHANDIDTALRLALLSGIKTRDLGGHATTIEFTRIIINALPRRERYPKSLQSHETKPPSMPPKVRPEPGEGQPEASRWTPCGVDVYIRHDVGIPDVPKRSGILKLQMIANRGTKAAPGAPADITLINWHCCRYLAESAMSDQAVLGLLQDLTDKGFRWMHVEKLHVSDEGPRYSLAQGE